MNYACSIFAHFNTPHALQGVKKYMSDFHRTENRNSNEMRRDHSEMKGELLEAV